MERYWNGWHIVLGIGIHFGNFSQIQEKNRVAKQYFRKLFCPATFLDQFFEIIIIFYLLLLITQFKVFPLSIYEMHRILY